MKNDLTLQYFAVIDVETNWNNQVMSIGVVIGDSVEFGVVDKRYYVIYPECEVGGMYSDRLHIVDEQLVTYCLRKEAVADIVDLLSHYGVADIFAYNALFDYNCMTELHGYVWRDILPIAANRNTNDKLPDGCEYFSTGLLKHGRGLQSIMQMVFWRGYNETHNALQDAVDELHLMQILGHPVAVYRECKPKQSAPVRKPTWNNRQVKTSLSAYKYVIDELCGGSVRLLDCTSTVKAGVVNGVESKLAAQNLTLQCMRCGRIWTQEAELFFRNPTCSECAKKDSG